MKNSTAVQVLFFLLITPLLQAQDSGQSILKETKASGLCLIIGDDSLVLGKDLAKNSNLYVQILQKDSAKAFAWGNELAKSPLREKLGVRLSGFDTKDYGSQLFNLIIVKNNAALGKATLSSLNRLLVPDGVVLLKTLPPSYAAEAKKLVMQSMVVTGWKAFGRGKLKDNWKVANSLKWRAGARAQWSPGWKGLTFGAGKFLYTESLEVPNDGVGARKMLFARDAFNGRVLWNIDLGYTTDKRGGISSSAISDDDVVLTIAKSKNIFKVVGLDANTGKVIFELPGKGNPFASKVQSISFQKGHFIVYGSGWVKVVDTKGKLKWTRRWGYRTLFKGDIAYNYGGTKLLAVKIKDGTVIWQLDIKAAWHYPMFLADMYIHINNRGQLYSISLATGKLASTYIAKPPKPFKTRFKIIKGELYDCWYHPYPKGGKSDFYWVKVDPKTGKQTGGIRESGTAYTANMCAPVIHGVGNKFVYFFNVWVDPDTSKREYTYLAHPSCHIGTKFAYNMAYNLPSRKAGPLHGISAIGPADITFDHEPGGKILEKFSGKVSSPEATKNTDWPLFRNNVQRSNATVSGPGPNLKLAWEAKVGLGGRTFGEMHEQRLGLTQPVIAWGLAIVADISAQRIVALDINTGKEKWVFHVGSRVDLSPTLYKGMCLFTSKDGWVWCLDAKTGKPIYRLLLTPRKRLIGGQDKLESQWPVVSDVMISKAGIAYVSCGIDIKTLGGIRALAFKPETGKVVWAKTYFNPKMGHVFKYTAPDIFVQDSRPDIVFMKKNQINAATGDLALRNTNKIGPALTGQHNMDNWLAGGVSPPRNLEDRMPIKLSSGVAVGKTLAFNTKLTVAYSNERGTAWEYKGKLPFFAKTKKGKAFTWIDESNELVMDDIVLTNKHVYAVGYYYRIKGEPELRVFNAATGKLIKKYTISGHASWNGMSIASNKVFISTREGKIICFQGK
ncbi:MAG: hypothetical protein COA79_04915 [Planctomycetota bacterium]|nr:MAG: hypothetical protein COA79_04915 [Planctomycetota bacterium]